MRPSEIRDMSADELRQKAADLRQEYFNLKIQMSTGQLEDNSRLSKLKKDVARVLTIIRERELGGKRSGK